MHWYSEGVRLCSSVIMQAWNLKFFLIYIQRDATLHSLFYLETALHISGGTNTHHQGRKEL